MENVNRVHFRGYGLGKSISLLWYPGNHHPHSIVYSDSGQHLESGAHIVNGCKAYRSLYPAGHDRTVDLIAAAEK